MLRERYRLKELALRRDLGVVSSLLTLSAQSDSPDARSRVAKVYQTPLETYVPWYYRNEAGKPATGVDSLVDRYKALMRDMKEAEAEGKKAE